MKDKEANLNLAEKNVLKDKWLEKFRVRNFHSAFVRKSEKEYSFLHLQSKRNAISKTKRNKLNTL